MAIRPQGPNKTDIRDTLTYLAVLIPSFLALQTVLILMHEFTHCTVAWLLGYMPGPFDIVWGNPILMTGWDEGVGYKKLVAQGHFHAEALIGFSPIIMHSMVVTLGIWLMRTKWLYSHKWLFHAVFWFIAAHFMELVAYIVMRPFALSGDTGHFNHGLGVSPWYLFIIGSLALGAALYFYYTRCLPRLDALFAPSNHILQWTILAFSAFIIFFWGSGIRIMAYVYPDPQWAFGLIAFPAFFAVVFWFRPANNV